LPEIHLSLNSIYYRILKKNRKQYSVRELQDENRFILIRILSLEDIIQFVIQQIRVLNPATVLFFVAALSSFFMMVFTLVSDVLPTQWGWAKIMLHCFNGFILWPVILIPIHELIHAAVYKVAGAPEIKFGIKPEKYLFYVTADKYVIGKKRFMMVAFTPFVIISIGLILIACFTVYPFSWSFIVSLFVHTTMCIGDFALAGFFMQDDGEEIYTYDDTENSVTYFYRKKSSLTTV
jgi:hypothetical protein